MIRIGIVVAPSKALPNCCLPLCWPSPSGACSTNLQGGCGKEQFARGASSPENEEQVQDETLAEQADEEKSLHPAAGDGAILPVKS